MKPLVSTLALTIALSAAGCATGPVATRVPAVANALSPEPGVVSAGRLKPVDIEPVHDAGIRQVIDLTPDAETPDFDEAAAVRSAGLAYSNLPLAGPDDLTHENVQAFDAMLRNAQRPVLVHCASGNRVGAMAALRAAWAEGRSTEDAIAIGKTWGLKGLEGEVRRRIELGRRQTGH
jgi:uncharacterized protein (TIGR01244 family)